MSEKTAILKKKINGTVYDLKLLNDASHVMINDEETNTNVPLTNIITKLKNEIAQLKERLTALENKDN